MKAKQRKMAFQTDQKNDIFSEWLDFFRWIAAFSVLFTHVRHRLFMPMSEMPPGSKTILFYIVGGASSFGPAAVIIFFVLSGFLVGGGSLRSRRIAGRFAFSDYFIARFSRLWVVLVPTFLLTYLLNIGGTIFFNGGAIIGSVQHDPYTFICNVAFLQTALCQQYGGNGALWSLFHEFWYYVTWPIFMFAIFSDRNLIIRIGSGFVAVFVLTVLAWYQFVGPNIAVYSTIWLLGVLAFSRKKPLLKVSVSVSVSIFVFSLIIWRILQTDSIYENPIMVYYPIDLVIALAFANLILNMKNSAESLSPPPLQFIHKPLASFSFTLYCIHTPIINALGAFMVWYTGTGWHMLPIGFKPYAIFALTVFLCVLLAYLMALVTERHTPQLRRAVLAAMKRQTGLPSSG